MIVTTTTICNINNYVSKHDRHAKNKLICTLLGILRVPETSRAFSDWLPLTASRDGSQGCSYLGMKGRINHGRLQSMGPWFHTNVDSHRWLSGYTCKSHIETGHQWCCHKVL
jgi:hypothetical protein